MFNKEFGGSYFYPIALPVVGLTIGWYVSAELYATIEYGISMTGLKIGAGVGVRVIMGVFAGLELLGVLRIGVFLGKS